MNVKLLRRPKIGEKLLLVTGVLSVEEIVSVVGSYATTEIVDVTYPSDPVRSFVLNGPPTRFLINKLQWFASPARINLSGHGEHEVVGVYCRK